MKTAIIIAIVLMATAAVAGLYVEDTLRTERDIYVETDAVVAPPAANVFTVTDGGGEAFRVTDNGGEDYNVQ